MSNTTKETPIVLHDGSFSFGIKLPNGEIFEQTIDLILTKIACEECERRHSLQVVNGSLQSTTAFLIDLAATLSSLGVKSAPDKDCSPCVAFQLWHAVSAKIGQLKKNMNEPPNSPTGTESNPEENPPK